LSYKTTRRSALSRRRVWQLLREIADPVGRAGTRGRPILWKLRTRNSGTEDQK
jgi:hypothetical protein